MIYGSDIKIPVKQDMMYMVEYADGTTQGEFNLITADKFPFEGLRVNEAMRFGLVGVSAPMYVETYGGYFHIAGRNIQAKYVTDDGQEHYLIGQPKFYQKLLYYKTGMAELPMTPKAELVAWGKPEGEIVSFHFGYSEKLQFGDLVIDFTAVCNVPYQDNVTINFKLQANKELNGQLVILRNGVEVYSDNAPIDPDLGGEVKWMVS